MRDVDGESVVTVEGGVGQVGIEEHVTVDRDMPNRIAIEIFDIEHSQKRKRTLQLENEKVTGSEAVN
jgi:hypothetical protein